jgi:cytochrome c oxidase subunit III
MVSETLNQEIPKQKLDPRRKPVIPHGVLGVLIFVASEIMFFGGMMSAFAIVKSGAVGQIWPPPGQPRLPVEATALNSVVLLLSGFFLFRAGQVFRISPQSAKTPFQIAIVLGSVFVLFQGFEWVGLLREGLTMTSSVYGAFFYFIVGTHALHAIAALVVLALFYIKFVNQKLTAEGFWAMRLYWYFVVLLWPALYTLVYL